MTRHRDDKGGHPVAPGPDSEVIRVPTDLPAATRDLVDLVAQYVSRGGMALEQDIARLQSDNPNFNFINAAFPDPVNVYYRWRLYSFLQGDTTTRWRTEPYQVMSEGHRWWIPPPPPTTLISGNSASATQVKNPELYALIAQQGVCPDALPVADRSTWFSMLSNLREPNREKICDAMVFALDRSLYAHDLLETLVEAIGFFGAAQIVIDAIRKCRSRGSDLAEEQETVEMTALTKRILSRCFLLSDILCNVFSTAHGPTASPRSILKAADFVLPRFFEDFMCFVVLVHAELNGADSAASPTTIWELASLEPESILWHVVSWVRELWALWQLKGVVSPHLSSLINTQYMFLLV